MILPDFIWIIGNVGSGKTTLTNQIAKNEKFNQHFKLNIDSFRIQYNQERTRCGENMACEIMEDHLNNQDKILLESVGSWGSMCKDRFADKNTLIIVLENSKEQSLNRIEERLKLPNQTPFPENSSMKFTIESYSQSWDRFQSQLIDEHLYSDRSKIIKVESKSPEQIYQEFLKIVGDFCETK